MTWLQGGASTNPAINTLGRAYTSNVTAGSTLLAFLHWTSTRTFTSLIDSLGNTWTLVDAEINNATLANRCRLYRTVTASGGANLVTLTVSGNAFIYVGVAELSTGHFDTNAVGAQGSSTTITSGSLTVAQNGADLVGFAVCGGTGAAPAGYTARITVNGDLVWTKDSVTAGAQTMSATQSPTNAYVTWALSLDAGAVASLNRPSRVSLAAVQRASLY